MRVFFRVAIFLSLGMVLLFADFLSKAYVYHFFPFGYLSHAYPYGGKGVFENFLGIECSISLAINKGAAWGVLADFQIPLLVLRILLVSAMIFYLIFFNSKREIQIPFLLIIIGAIGNIIDFFLYGFVVDFIHLNFWGYDFPIFNIADTCISLGVVWLFLSALLSKRKKNAITN